MLNFFQSLLTTATFGLYTYEVINIDHFHGWQVMIALMIIGFKSHLLLQNEGQNIFVFYYYCLLC